MSRKESRRRRLRRMKPESAQEFAKRAVQNAATYHPNDRTRAASMEFANLTLLHYLKKIGRQREAVEFFKAAHQDGQQMMAAALTIANQKPPRFQWLRRLLRRGFTLQKAEPVSAS